MAFEGTIQEFTVSMHGNTLEYPFIEVQQGDTASRRVRIHLKTFGGADFLIPYGATAVLSVDKTDGHKVLNECEIEDSSTIIITLTSQTLACPGKQLSQIYIFTDKGDIKTQKFYINVPKAVYDQDAIESSDEYGILQDLIVKIEAMDDGVTFTPHVSEDGTLTWSNDGGMENPEPVNIIGPPGEDGEPGADGQDGYTPEIGENENWFINGEDTGMPSRGKQGEKGDDGEKGEKGDTGEDGKSAYEYAKDGGYTGTEEEFATKLAEEGMTVVDTSGLVGEAGKTVMTQELLDVISDAVLNKLVTKAMMSGVQIDSADMVPTSALVYAMQEAITKLNSETKLLTVFVTPQMFGAVADGVTDDTEAFKKAVATGEALYIPKGNYYLSEVLSYADLETVKIICDGSIYMESQEAQTNLFYMSNCKNVEIAGLKVESTRDKTGTAPDGHTRTDYSSSNVVPFYIYNSEYVTVKNSVFINPDYSFFIRGLFDDEAEVKTKVVIDNVSVVNPCMGCFVDRLKEFNISNSSFYMANGLSAGDHAIYATRYIEKVNIDACYFWTDESDEAIGPMLDFTAYEKCVQNAIISNCIFDCRIPIYAQGNGKYVISNCISKSSSYFVRPSGGVDVTILNCQIESDADVISPSHTDKEQYIAPMNVLISNSRVNALHLYNFDSTEEAEINITTNDCDIETTGLAIYSSVSTVNYKFINSRLTMAAEESFVRYYHANRMEFVGCEIVSPKGLFYCKADIEENNVTLINCFLEAPSLYRSTEPTNKITCYNSYLNGELIDKPYLTEDELSDAINDALSIAKESGEFDGTDGKDGSTPVKGTDYFTDSDKAEMVNSVISELPTVTMVGVDEDGTEHTWTIYGKVVS